MRGGLRLSRQPRNPASAAAIVRPGQHACGWKRKFRGFRGLSGASSDQAPPTHTGTTLAVRHCPAPTVHCRAHPRKIAPETIGMTNRLQSAANNELRCMCSYHGSGTWNSCFRFQVTVVETAPHVTVARERRLKVSHAKAATRDVTMSCHACHQKP